MRFAALAPVALLVLAGCADPGPFGSEGEADGDDLFADCRDVCATAPDPAATAMTGHAPGPEGKGGASEASDLALRCPDPCGVEALRGGLWEPQGAVDPSDPAHMVVAFRTSDFRGFTVMVTTDSGATWERGAVPVGPGAPAGILRDSNYLGDASVAFLPDGTVIVAGLAGNLTEPVDGGPSHNTARSVIAARSTDGGRTFQEAALVMPGEGRWVHTGLGEDQFLFWESMDKPWVAAGADGRLLLSWIAIRGGAGLPVVMQSSVSFDLLSSVSRDGGRTWSEPQVVEGDMPFGFTHPAILPNGGMAIVHGGYGQEQSVFTSDDGASWQKHAVGRSAGQPILKADAGPYGPRLLLGYPAAFGDGRIVPVVRASYDGGATWSGGVLLSEDMGTPHLGMDVAADGTIVVGWYEADGTDLAYRAAALPAGGAPTPVLTVAAGIAGEPTRYGDYVAVVGAAADGGLAGWFAAGDGGDHAFRAARLTLVPR